MSTARSRRPMLAVTALTCLSVTALAACSNGGSSTASGGSTKSANAVSSQAGASPAGTASSGAPPAGSAHGKTLVYVGSANGDTLYGAIACGAKAEAERLGANYKYQTIGASYAPSAQIPTLDAAAATDPDGIMISPADPNALYAAIEAVVSRNIPVVTVDNTLANPDRVTSQVLVDNRASGVLAADYFGRQAAGRPEKVALLTIPLGLTNASDDENRGFEAELKKYPNLTFVGATYANVDVADNTAAASAILARNPDLFGIFGTQQFADEGAVAAAEELNAHPLIVAGYGGQDNALIKDLKASTVAAITDFPLAKAGAAAIDQLVNKLADRPVDQDPTFEAVLYTKADLTKPGLVLGSKEASC